jgi:uridine kinase
MADTKKIKVTISGTGEIEVLAGTTLRDLLDEHFRDKTPKYKIIAGKVNYEIQELKFALTEDCGLRFIDLTDEDGMRIYRRSLYFMYSKAINDLFPKAVATLSHSISLGLFCDITEVELSVDDVKKIEERMREFVKMEIPFKETIVTLEEGKRIFTERNRLDKCEAMAYRSKDYVRLYEFDGYVDYLYGFMAPDSSFIVNFELMKYASGVIIRFPMREEPDKLPKYFEQPTLFSVFMEFKNWTKITGVPYLSDLNKYAMDGRFGEYVRIAEALQEKKLAKIADEITENKNEKKVIMIAGPSSSGKTTFAKRLEVQLRVNGVIPVTLGTDDYFVNRDKIPYEADGSQNFENIDVVDADYLSNNLHELLNGKTVKTPIFDFVTGTRSVKTRDLRLEKNNVIIIEGIHGLNENLAKTISRDKKYKIFVSVLTCINIDRNNRIPSGDVRILRRIVRDNLVRNSSPIDTIRRWSSVRRGENLNILPFMEEADIMFNSSLFYELCVMKPMIMPLLLSIKPDCEEYSEAVRLISFLDYVEETDVATVPPNSIIREFIGGSCF